ncbi:putative DNA-directed RNA polymerase [Dioscorea sansibarensis]
MTKPIPRIGSRRNGRIGSRKNAHRIPKGVIHVVSWASAGTSGFKGIRRGTPYAAQAAVVNAIRTIIDQDMQRAEVMIKGAGFGIDAALRAIRRSGIEESVHEILLNLKEIVLRSNLYEIRDASICVRGPRYVTAQGIISPPYAKIVHTTQYISNLTEPIDLCIELQINRDCGYRMKPITNSQDGSYPIDAVFMPIPNANHSIHSYGNGNEKQEIHFLEIWTNGNLTPKEALYEASHNLIDLFVPFLHAEEADIDFEENKNKFTLPSLTFKIDYLI